MPVYGGELVDLHARNKGEPRGISYPVKCDNVIEEVRYQPPSNDNPQSAIPNPQSMGRVWINDRQYFEGIPESAWTFPIGGYLPAQRWIKDRISRTLSFDDQQHYIRV